MDAAKKKNGHSDTSSDTAVSLKKGDFNTPPLIHFSKGKRQLEIQDFKTAVLRRKADCNGLVLIPEQLLSKEKSR